MDQAGSRVTRVGEILDAFSCRAREGVESFAAAISGVAPTAFAERNQHEQYRPRAFGIAILCASKLARTGRNNITDYFDV